MRRGWLALAASQLPLVVVTIPPFLGALGEPTWHHNASLGVSLVASALGIGLARDKRRHLVLGVALWTTLAIVSGFLLLYLKPDLKDWGYKDWAKFWHIAWSWMALWYGILHIVWNRLGQVRSLRWQHQGIGKPVAYDATWGLVLAAIPLTWSSWGAERIREDNFIPWTLWTVLAVVGVAYAAWWLWKVRRPSWMGRNQTQHFVDSWMLPVFILANLSGFPLLYAGTKDLDIKYVAKYWHVWPSVAMTVLVSAHTIQFLPGVVAHYRRIP